MNRKFILLVLILTFTGLLSGCIRRASAYSEDEHIQRVSKLIEERYFTAGGEHTDYEVFPVYNQFDELKYFIVDFEPTGFVYIKIQERDKSLFWGPKMYIRMVSAFDSVNQTWQRYTIKEGSGDKVKGDDKIWETDEEGNLIFYSVSHYKAANIKDEKRYLLRINQGGSIGYIPAIKRGELYLNLVSMEEFKYESEFEKEIHAYEEGIYFIAKPELNL